MTIDQLLVGKADFNRIYPTSDNLGYYIATYINTSPYFSVLWKYLFSDSGNSYWQSTSNMILSPSLFLVINEISFIIGKVTSDSSADLVFMRVTYGSTSIMWSNSISCPSTGCYDESTEGVLSEDNSKFYSIRVYGVNPYYALFNSFNASDGTVIGNRYVSNVNCNYATIALNDALLVIALVCNSIPTIALYDFADDNFSFYYELTSRTGFFYYIITNPMNDA